MILDKKQLPYISVSSVTITDPATQIKHVIETVDTSIFDNKLIDFLGACYRHKYTVGEAAPFPEHDIFRPVAEAMMRGEDFSLTHIDQLVNDWECAVKMDTAKSLPAPATPADVAPADVTDKPSLWARMVSALNILLKGTP